MSIMDQTGETTFGARLRFHAAMRGAAVAVTVITNDGTARDVNWTGLDRFVDQVAHALAKQGAAQGTVVGIGLRNGLLHLATVLASWRLGATIMAFDPTLPAAQLSTILARAGAGFAVVEDGTDIDDGQALRRTALEKAAAAAPATPVEDKVSRPGKILLSGGSTGVSKLMTDDVPWTRSPGRSWGNVAPALGFGPDQVQLVCGAMSHNAPLTWAHIGLFEGHRLVVMETFDARRTLRAIDRYQVEFVMVVPTMMVRMLDVLGTEPCSFASLRSFYHTGAPCPVWLKRSWIERLGAERVFEMYGSGENVGQTIISGPDWLSHPGSVGRAFETDVRVLDAQGRQLPPGEIGELYMRRWSNAGAVHYLDPAIVPRTDPEGFTCVGDMAWLDEEGFVYLAGRRDDVINTGGVKLHPERIEAAILSHPDVRDVVVVGVDDREWGQRVHAVIEAAGIGTPIDLAELRRHCAGRLTGAEMPKSLSFVADLPRDGFGKVRRRAVRDGLQGGAVEAGGRQLQRAGKPT